MKNLLRAFIRGFADVIGAAAVFLIVFLLLTGCSYTIERDNFRVEVEEGFLRSYTFTQLKDSKGNPVPGSDRLTICNGWAGFASDIMKSSAIVAAGYFVGNGLKGSGSNVSSNSTNQTEVRVNSNANSNSRSDSTANNFNSSESHYSGFNPKEIENHQKDFSVLSEHQVHSLYHREADTNPGSYLTE